MIEVFDKRELGLVRAYQGAMECVARGGQALHVWVPKAPGVYAEADGRKAPACFRRTKVWAHLMDADAERLEATARRLGVRRVVVSKRGHEHQHVDLCGKPLERAIREAACRSGFAFRSPGRADEIWLVEGCFDDAGALRWRTAPRLLPGRQTGPPVFPKMRLGDVGMVPRALRKKYRSREDAENVLAGYAARNDLTPCCCGCGCTDDDCSQCIEDTGAPCKWVKPGLCSVCDDLL